MKISSQSLFIALVAGIPGLVVAGLLMWWSAELQSVHIQHGIRETVRALSLAVDREILRARAIAESIAASPDIDARNFENVHRQAVGVSNESGWVVLARRDGEQVLNALLPYGQPIPRAAAAKLINTVLETGKPQISNLLVGSVAARPIVSVGVPVIRDRKVIYVAVFAFGTEAFQALLDEQNLPRGAVVSVIDRDGITIARNVDPEQWVAKPVGQTLQTVLAQKEGTGVGRTREGISVFFAWTTSPVSGWRVSMGVPTEIVNAPVRWMFFLFAIAFAFVLIGIVAAVVIGRRVNRQLTESIEELSQAAVAMGHGAPITLRERASLSEIDAVTKSMRWAYDTIQERALEQERARDEAVEANHAKDEFIATLAHEVRTPLSAIATAAEILERSTPRRETQIIRRQVQHLTSLITELFEAARIAMNKFILIKRPMNLTRAIRECLDSVSFDRKRYDLKLDAREEVWIEGDETRIQQVIFNLITNAIKFTPNGGTIKVTVQRRGDSALIEVTDPGIGMSSSLIPRVFDLFVQGDRIDGASSGMGIGLSLVRRLVELHGGKVEASSEGKDKGSTFTVTLPSMQVDVRGDRSAAA